MLLADDVTILAFFIQAWLCCISLLNITTGYVNGTSWSFVINTF